MDRASTTLTDLANLAAGEFQQRQERANAMVRRGDMPADIVNARLRPWLAIACLLGANLPELDEGLAELRVCQTFPGGEMGSRSEADARTILAADICPRATWLNALATARDAAIRAGHAESTATLRALGDALKLTIPYRSKEVI